MNLGFDTVDFAILQTTVSWTCFFVHFQMPPQTLFKVKPLVVLGQLCINLDLTVPDNWLSPNHHCEDNSHGLNEHNAEH